MPGLVTCKKKEIYKVLTPSQGLARQSNNIVHFLDKAHGLCHSPSQNPLMTPYSILKSTPSATGNQGSTIWQPQTIFTVFSPKQLPLSVCYDLALSFFYFCCSPFHLHLPKPMIQGLDAQCGLVRSILS